MNAVGVDVSKGKSTVAVLRPFGEIVAEPFDVVHNDNDLKKLVKRIKSLPGEGLEFDCVIIDMNDGFNAKEFYVAMTRAMKRIYIISNTSQLLFK